MTKRSYFTKEFKLEAVCLLDSGEKSGTELARELGSRRNMELHSAATENKVLAVLNGLSLTQFLGETWVRQHPGVNQCIAGFEAMLKDEASR